MKLYVGTYKKYNSGSIAGGWLNLDDYKNKAEFLKAYGECHHLRRYDRNYRRVCIRTFRLYHV